MKQLQAVLRSISLVGQLGISIVTPPLVFIFLARLAIERLGFGAWILLVAIVLGLVTAFCSARSLLRRFLKADKKAQKLAPPASNRHL